MHTPFALLRLTWRTISTVGLILWAFFILIPTECRKAQRKAAD